jgi:hypothetical protein
MVNSNLRWNYSPLKRKGRPVAGRSFRLANIQENKFLYFHLRVADFLKSDLPAKNSQGAFEFSSGLSAFICVHQRPKTF